MRIAPSGNTLCVLTRTLVLVLLVAAVGTVVSSLALGGKVKLSVAQAHGKIGSVTPTRIKVGPVVCSIRHRTPAVGRFAVGDLVTVVCRNGILTSVKLAVAAAKAAQSQTGQAQSTQSVTQQGRPGQSQSVTSSTTSSSTSSSSTSSSSSSKGSSGGTSSSTDASASGSSTGPDGTTTTWASTNARGTITALSPSSITVGTLTCSIDPSLAGLIGPRYHVGDTASIACHDGALQAIAT